MSTPKPTKKRGSIRPAFFIQSYWRAILTALLLTSLTLPISAGAASNKDRVIAFYTQMFVDKEVLAAVRTYLGERYIQHNPYVPDGVQPLLDHFIPLFKTYPEFDIQIKRVVAEDDLVVVHSAWQKTGDSPRQAVVDIFRLENGAIVEHWDVVQTVPAQSANNNTMF